MKVVINKCYGGYSLSPLAVTKYHERKTGGKPIFWYSRTSQYPKPDRYNQITLEQAINSSDWFITAFDTELPTTFATRGEANEFWQKHRINSRPEDRSDPDLVAVVEELGDKASGTFAELEVIEIPDGVAWHVEEYDGMEHIAEDHRTWS